MKLIEPCLACRNRPLVVYPVGAHVTCTQCKRVLQNGSRDESEILKVKSIFNSSDEIKEKEVKDKNKEE